MADLNALSLVPLTDEAHMRLPQLILIVPLAISGCQNPCPLTRPHQWLCYNRTIDDFLASKTAREVARLHLTQLYSKQCRPTCDFQAGFEQAYVDVALGADGTAPAMPPSPYWMNCARTAEGHQRAEEWLSGYTAGAEQALACRGPHNRVIANVGACACH